MKTLALMIAFVLQTTGLWSHMPVETRTKLSQAAVPAPASLAPETVRRLGSLALPLRHGAGTPAFAASMSILAIDRATATPLYQQQDTKRRPIASLTKLVTALVILDRHDPSDQVTVPTLPTYDPAYAQIGLIAGETYRWGDLVRAALVPSANDAADALALADSGTQAEFAALMNRKLSTWGIEDARFTNPSGLEDDGNYATAQAMGEIARLALAHPFIREATGFAQISLTSSRGRTLTAVTTNKLLASGGFYGIKTGYTVAAGECYIGLTKVAGHEVITVVLGSADRFGDTQTLINWIGRNYTWL
jgi:serine-type D-Ala-D-Ala carboxypeptidase (penicillin-binding protein 5/6)